MSEGNEGTEGQATTETTDVATSAAVETETPVTETATEETATEGEKPEAAEETTEDDKPKRESQNKRLKRKNQYLQSEILRLQELANKPPADEAKAPREEDFNGDWGKYIAATAAHEAAKAVKGTLAETRKSDNETRVAELRSEVLEDFEIRKDEFKSTKAKDFDEVVSSFVDKGGKFSDVVRDLVIDSDVGPQATYYLAKNPAIANKLNSLPPLQAAKEFARLEDTLSKPSGKATQAKPPVTPVKGGASGEFDPAKADMETYIAKRKAGWKG